MGGGNPYMPPPKSSYNPKCQYFPSCHLNPQLQKPSLLESQKQATPTSRHLPHETLRLVPNSSLRKGGKRGRWLAREDLCWPGQPAAGDAGMEVWMDSGQGSKRGRGGGEFIMIYRVLNINLDNIRIPTGLCGTLSLMCHPINCCKEA